MSLSRRQQRLLSRIDDAVSRSDPQLAGMLAVFGRLAASEPMPRRVELRTADSTDRCNTSMLEVE